MDNVVLTILVADTEIDGFREAIAPLLGSADAIELDRRSDRTEIRIASARVSEVAEEARRLGLQVDEAVVPDPLAEARAADAPLDELLTAIGGAGVTSLTTSFPTPLALMPWLMSGDDEPEVLPCPAELVFATGSGVGTADDGDPPTDREKAVLAARRSAIDAFAARVPLEMGVRCTAPCVPHRELRMGEAEVDIDSGGAAARVPWEGVLVCRKSAPFDPSTPRTRRPAPCEAIFRRNGIVRAHTDPVTTTRTGSLTHFSPTPELVRDAMREGAKATRRAIEALPPCPQISCPVPRITVSFELNFKTEVVDSALDWTKIRGVAEVRWNLEQICDKRT